MTSRRLAHGLWPLAALVALLASCADSLFDDDASAVVTVVVTPDGTDLRIGRRMQLRAFGLDASGAYRPRRPVQWSSDQPAIATVDDSGTVTGVGEGLATISATIDGVKGEARVLAGPAPRLALTRDSVAFEGRAGEADPPSDTVGIRNLGGLTLLGLIVSAIRYDFGAADWLMASIDSSTAPATLTLTARTAGVTTAGTYRAAVSVAAVDADSSPRAVQVTLRITPAPAATAEVAEGDGQSATANTPVAIPPAVRVRDQFDNLVPHVAVTFSVIGGGGSVTGGSTTTDGTGVARVDSWTLGSTTGTNTLQASVAGGSVGPVTFTAEAVSPDAGEILSNSLVDAAGPITASAGSSVSTVTVTVRDGDGNPLSGRSVTIAVSPTTGNTVTQPTATTDANGRTTGSWYSTKAELKTVSAAIVDVGTITQTDNVTVHPDSPSLISKASADPQTAVTGNALSTSPSVLVTDEFSNPVSGVSVTFAVTLGGGTATETSQTTNSSGIATVTSWTVRASGAGDDLGRTLNTLRASMLSGTVSTDFTGYAIYSYASHIHPMWARSYTGTSGSSTTACTACHGASSGSSGLELGSTSPTTTRGELYDVTAVCNGSFKRIPIGTGTTAVNNSVLMRTLDNTMSSFNPIIANCDAMPVSTNLWPDGVRDTVRAWVKNGSPAN